MRTFFAAVLLTSLAPSAWAGALLNLSYNGPVDSTDVRLGFIVGQTATFVLTAESFPGSGGTGIPDPTLELVDVIDGSSLFYNDDCNADIVSLLNRPLTTTFDACAVLELNPGPYAIVARDAQRLSGNILVGLTELPSTIAQFLPRITLAWDTSASANVGGYWLYYGTASTVYTSKLNVGNRTSYGLIGLKSGGLYFFSVTAYSRVDSALESGFSNEVSAIIPYNVLGKFAVRNRTEAVHRARALGLLHE